MNPIDEMTALIKQNKNAGPLIEAVNKIALDEDNLAAWDCLIALDKAAQEMKQQSV